MSHVPSEAPGGLIADALTLLPRSAAGAVQRARLSLVPRPTPTARRTPFVVMVATVLLAGVVGLLLFNTSMQQASFRAAALQTQADALRAEQQALQMQLDRLRDPQRVAERAVELGMVAMSSPAFLNLADGSVSGEGRPATREDATSIDALPTRLTEDLRRPVLRIPAPVADPGVASPETGPGRDTKKKPNAR